MARAHTANDSRAESKTDRLPHVQNPLTGDILMDSPQATSWRELCTYACDRDHWRERIRAFKQPQATEIKMGPHREPGTTISFTVS